MPVRQPLLPAPFKVSNLRGCVKPFHTTPQNIIWHKAQEKDFCYSPDMAFGSILSNFTSKTKSDEVLAVSRYSSITLFYNRG